MFISLVYGLISYGVDTALVVYFECDWLGRYRALHVSDETRQPNSSLACSAGGDVFCFTRKCRSHSLLSGAPADRTSSHEEHEPTCGLAGCFAASPVSVREAGNHCARDASEGQSNLSGSRDVAKNSFYSKPVLEKRGSQNLAR